MGSPDPGAAEREISSLKLIDLRDLRARRRDITSLSALTGPESSRDVYRLAQTAHSVTGLQSQKSAAARGS